ARPRGTPAAVDYRPAEAVIAASGAAIRFRPGLEVAYYYPPADHIVFPLKGQFERGPGGLPAYYDSLFHQLAHFSEPRLGWSDGSAVGELRAEIAAPSLAAQIGIPTLCDLALLTNHRNHVGPWVEAMGADPALIFRTADAASQAVEHLLSQKGR